LLAAGVSAQLPSSRSQPQTDPLEFGSLRLETAFASSPDDGEWDVSLTVSEFNMWAHSWHTFATHREMSRRGLPVSPEELRGIESNFPDDSAWHVDLEGWRTDLVLSRGLPNGWSVSAKVPFIRIGAPHWDAVAETFHDGFGLETVERDWFRPGDTLVYLKSDRNERIVEARGELDGSGLGDVSLGLGIPLRASQRLVVSIEVPSGDRGGLRGSGGLDANVSWFGSWRTERSSIGAALGYTHLDPNGAFLGLRRSEHLGHALLSVDRVLWRELRGTASVRVDTSPLGRVIDGYAGAPSTFYRLGVALPTDSHGWIAFELGEELAPVTGLEADWSFHLTWGTRLR
jgi:hypothetical protein